MEIPLIARDPLDQRIDLVEGPALPRPAVAGDRAGAEAHHAGAGPRAQRA